MIRQSESVAALADALAKVQAELPAIPKTHVGKIQGTGKRGDYEYSYHYADLADTVAAAAPILTRNGISVTQFPEFDNGEDVLTTRIMHTTGQWLEASMRLFMAKQDPQGQGSAVTYARRYAYCAALGIVADEDDDGAAASQPARGRSQGTTTRQAPVRANPQTGEITDDPATMDLRAVTAALEALKLPVTGNLAQKRLRLAEARAGVAPANVASNGSEMITEKQIALVNTLFNEKGFPADPAERHRYEGFIVGRAVESIHQLTRKEGHDLIEALKAEEVREAEQPSLLDAESGEPF